MWLIFRIHIYIYDLYKHVSYVETLALLVFGDITQSWFNKYLKTVDLKMICS